MNSWITAYLRDGVQDRTEEEEQKPEANYLVAERRTGWHSR